MKANASIAAHMIGLGLTTGIVLVGFGVLAGSTQLSGAVVASGLVVVESHVKKVQHPTGGVVKEILVTEGQRISAGQVVLRFDEVVANSNLAAAQKGYLELQARQQRLEAERDDRAELSFSSELVGLAAQPAILAMMNGERRLFELRRGSAATRKSQLRERIMQLKDEAKGLKDQYDAKQQEYDLIQKELVGVDQLWNQKLVSISRLTTLQREAARLRGELGRLTASTAQTQGKVTEMMLQIAQIDDDNRRDVAKELSDVRARSEELFERRVTALDTASRIEVRASQEGIVHDLTAHTNGGVVTAGETIMTIVPANDSLLVEARIAPQDISQVRADQPVTVRFPSFNQRTTPELTGRIQRVGADLSREDKTGPGFFVIRIAVPMAQVDRLTGARLVPGMPADVFVRTSERSMLSYLAKPLTDQLQMAFRER